MTEFEKPGRGILKQMNFAQMVANAAHRDETPTPLKRCSRKTVPLPPELHGELRGAIHFGAPLDGYVDNARNVIRST